MGVCALEPLGGESGRRLGTPLCVCGSVEVVFRYSLGSMVGLMGVSLLAPPSG